MIAKTPAHVYGTTESTADPELVADHPEIQPLLAQSIGALAWHPSGWLAAGSSSGCIAHVQRNGRVRIYRGAPKGIQAMLFVEDGAALLVGGTEKHLRVYPLLDDERDGTF